MARKSETERLQVPVNGELAAAIADLAEKFDRPASWLAVLLLEAAIEDREKFGQWAGLAFVGKAYEIIKTLAKGRPKAEREREEVRLQLNVPAETVRRIEKIAEQLGQSPVKAAAMLLASGVHHHEAFIQLAGAVQKTRNVLRGGSMRSQVSHRDERNPKLIMCL